MLHKKVKQHEVCDILSYLCCVPLSFVASLGGDGQPPALGPKAAAMTEGEDPAAVGGKDKLTAGRRRIIGNEHVDSTYEDGGSGAGRSRGRSSRASHLDDGDDDDDDDDDGDAVLLAGGRRRVARHGRDCTGPAASTSADAYLDEDDDEDEAASRAALDDDDSDGGPNGDGDDDDDDAVDVGDARRATGPSGAPGSADGDQHDEDDFMCDEHFETGGDGEVEEEDGAGADQEATFDR